MFKVVLRVKANINDFNRLFVSFLFIGLIGVGKIELVRVLVFVLFDSEK